MAPTHASADVQTKAGAALRWATGAVIGLVACFVGLAIAELVAAASPRIQSPVLDVGDRVIDSVPNSIKSLAIDWFGTKDKLALLVGIGAILGVYAAALGMLAVSRHWRVAIVGAALFGVVGAYASQSTRRTVPWYGVVPSVVGALVAAGVLYLFRQGDDDPSESTVGTIVSDDRRSFLGALGGLVTFGLIAGSIGRWLTGRDNVSGQRADLTLPNANEPLATPPPDVAVGVDGVAPFYTPNTDFYRIDTALTVPQVSIETWSLKISGMVDAPFELSFDELLARGLVESDITLTCVSNEIGGGLLGTARWLGVRLDDLIADAAAAPDADQIVGRSVDGYTCGFPIAALDGRDALVAVGMNGEPLPVEHGYPARLIVPGLYGYVSATKWLTELELTRFDRFDQYWVERGWVEQAPIKTQSRIDTPRGLQRVAAGTVVVAGTAWAQTRGVDRVELRVDDGEWVGAELAAELNDVTWRQWRFAWEANPGRHTITVRATDRTGAIQTEDRSEPFPSGATGQHQIVVLVD